MKLPFKAPSTLRAGLRLLVIEGLSSQTMVSLTTGVFLIGLVVELGASPFVVGLIGSIPFITVLWQLPSVWFVEKFRDRRAIVFWACLVSRCTIPLVAVCLWLLAAQPSLALAVIVGLTFIRYSADAFAGCAWNSWMNDLVPKRMLGRFFGNRMRWMTAMGVAAGLGAGWLLDFWKSWLPEEMLLSYAILFAIAFLPAMISTAQIAFLPHRATVVADREHLERHFRWKDFMLPLKHENFRYLVHFMATWNFAVNLALPFFPVYMLQVLDYDMATVIYLTILTQLVYLFALRMWGRYGDYFSHKAVLGLCCPVYGLCFIGWTFVTLPEPHAYSFGLVVGLHVVMGAVTSGINLAINNIALKLCPANRSTTYLTINNMFAALAGGIAPLLGGALVIYTADMHLSAELVFDNAGRKSMVTTLALTGWEFFFLGASILAALAMIPLARLQESGVAQPKLLLRHMVYDTWRKVGAVSSIAGQSRILDLPHPVEGTSRFLRMQARRISMALADSRP